MVDTARALLDELMGRNRDLGPNVKAKRVNWDDPEFCQYYLVKFCPHDLFVNTRADLGPCPKLHDDEAKRMYEAARPGARKKQYEDEFLRFCNNMINEVDRKIQKGRQRLLLMNKGEGGPVYISKFQEQLNNLNARIKKLLNEAEEAGHRGDVDQAQGLMTLCEQLKEEKEALLSQHDNSGGVSTGAGALSTTAGSSAVSATNSVTGIPNWAIDLNTSQEKQMEVCEVCGAFLIVGDAQQRIEDHLTGKQHLGYSRLRKAVEEMYEKRQKEREEEERRREEERKAKEENGMDRNRRDRDRDRRGRNDYEERKRRGYSRDHDRRDKDRYPGRDYRSTEPDRRDRERNERYKRDNERRRKTRSRSRSHSRR